MLDPTKSSTLQQTTQRISLNYGSGSASGVLDHDTITMGPFTVNPQTFGVYPPVSIPPSPFPRVDWVFLFPVGTCDNVCCEMAVMAVSISWRQSLISHRLRSKRIIDLPFPASVPAFP